MLKTASLAIPLTIGSERILPIEARKILLTDPTIPRTRVSKPKAEPAYAQLTEIADSAFKSSKLSDQLRHPAAHGVFRLVLELDGEVVERVDPHIGLAPDFRPGVSEHSSNRLPRAVASNIGMVATIPKAGQSKQEQSRTPAVDVCAQ